MVAVADVVDALGGGLLRTLVAAPGQTVTDIVIAEPRDRAVDLAGDLVVGAGVADGAEAVELVERAAAAGAAGVVLRRGPARARGVRAAAKRSGVALLELADSASLVHAVGVIQGVVDRAAAPDAALVDPGGEADLLALADAAAALVDGPVTIEDAQSRVVAYSTRQDVTDTARVSTVLGRRVPAPVVAYMRSRGVFRRLARSDEPFLVPPGPALEMPRYVVPVRAGGEWLGSIWAVIDHAPPDDAVAELRPHRLRRRTPPVAQPCPHRPHPSAVRGTASHPPRRRGRRPRGRQLASARAVARGRPRSHRTGLRRRRGGPGRVGVPVPAEWLAAAVAHRPRRAAVRPRGRRHAPPDGHPKPGTWPWLAELAAADAGPGGPNARTWIAAGVTASTPGALAASARSAAQVAALRGDDPLLGVAPTAEGQWAALTVTRAVAGLADGTDDALAGPVAVLAEHDRRRHTAYLPSLAAWLDHPGEPTAAAKSLGVHVNTLRHRMVRMSEVAPLGLDDPTERLALRLQLRARDL